MATTDIVTIAEARNYLGGSNADPTLLAAWITAASDAIDDLAGPVVQRTLTAELHNGGVQRVALKFRPVASVTSVTEYWYDGTSVTLTAETVSSKPAAGYLIDLSLGHVWRRNAGVPYTFEPGLRNVSVTYVAGRYASTSVVAPRFKTAALMQLAHLWRSEHGTAAGSFDQTATTPSGFAIPNRVVELLGSEVQVARTMGIA